MSVNPSDVVPKLAIEMLRLGIDAERLALGLGDAAPNMFDDRDDNSAVQEAVQVAMQILARHAGSLGPQSVNPPLQL